MRGPGRPARFCPAFQLPLPARRVSGGVIGAGYQVSSEPDMAASCGSDRAGSLLPDCRNGMLVAGRHRVCLHRCEANPYRHRQRP
jgi:hypothetical protein